jgi:hypothetical protein
MQVRELANLDFADMTQSWLGRVPAVGTPARGEQA